MSNKVTVKKSDNSRKNEENKQAPGSAKRRIDPAKYAPAAVVIALWILFFFYMD